MKKHLQKIILAAIMLLASNGIWAYDFQSGGIYYNITSNTSPYTVEVAYATTNYNSYSGTVVIPDSVSYNGRTYSVTRIGNSAFRNCTGLTSLSISASVTSIKACAFFGCNGLTSVTIPNSVTSIGLDAFAGCTGLTTINVDTNNSYFSSINGVLFNRNQTTLIRCPEGKSGSYTVPNSVTSIGSRAFFGCRGLTSVTIPNSVTSIGNNAFCACDGLTSVTIGNSVTSIGGYAFRECTGLTSVTIPNSVTSIGDYAFRYCTGLTSVTIGNSVTIIGDYAFDGCTGLTDITLKSYNPPSFGIYSFYGVPQTVNIFVPCGRTAVYLSATNSILPPNPNIIELPSFTFSATSSDIQRGVVQILTPPTCTNPQAVISATANSGYTFSRWSDGNTQNLRSLTVTQDTTLVAYFASNQGIAEAENDNISIRTANGHIMLEGVGNERVYVSDVLGRVVYNATVNEKAEIAVRNRGVYFVKIGSRPAQKVVVIR